MGGSFGHGLLPLDSRGARCHRSLPRGRGRNGPEAYWESVEGCSEGMKLAPCATRRLNCFFDQKGFIMGMYKLEVCMMACAVIVAAAGSKEVHAMGHARSSFPAVSADSMLVYDQVPLKATDGSMTALLSDSWAIAVADPSLASIPDASADADASLCGTIDLANLPAGGIQVYLDQDARMVNLESIAVRLMSAPLPRELAASDVVLIRSTPRCAPFDTAISMIAKPLEQMPQGHEALRLVSSRGLQVQSVQLGNRNGKGLVSLLLANGKVAEFKLADSVSSSMDGVPYNFLDASVAPG